MLWCSMTKSLGPTETGCYSARKYIFSRPTYEDNTFATGARSKGPTKNMHQFWYHLIAPFFCHLERSYQIKNNPKHREKLGLVRDTTHSPPIQIIIFLETFFNYSTS